MHDSFYFFCDKIRHWYKKKKTTLFDVRSRKRLITFKHKFRFDAFVACRNQLIRIIEGY